MDTTKNQINHLSLCSGYEGIGIGLRTVLPNLREIAFVEIEAFNIANLVAKMEEGKIHAAPIHTNIKTFPFADFRGCVDILSGGFPCQPFSNAGNRKATEDPRHLFPFIAEGIRQCRPSIVFLENVEGIISAKTADGESVLQYVIRELEGLGYTATAGIFSAAEVGASHQRKRVFIMGNAKHNGHVASEKPRSISQSQEEGRLQKLAGRSDAATELAHSENFGRRGWTNRDGDDSDGVSEQKTPEQSDLRSEAERCSGELRGEQRWPSRPGEHQHEWEEPRVTSVGDSKGKQSASRNHGEESAAFSESEQVEFGRRSCGSLRQSNGQAESKLGGTNDGSASGVDSIANRMDRLRSCGNGVVPQTAAKAFTTLLNRLI